MAEFRHDLDDRDDAEVRGPFEQHYTPITPSPDLVERLNQLVLREVQSVYHAEAVVAPAPAPTVPARTDAALARRLGPGQSLAMAGAAAVAVILIFFGLARPPRPVSATAAGRRRGNGAAKRTGEIPHLPGWRFPKVVQGDRIIALNGMTTVTLFPGQNGHHRAGQLCRTGPTGCAGDAAQVEMFVRRGRPTTSSTWS